MILKTLYYYLYLHDMKKIAAITMVRNGDFFLDRWVRYYGALLGRENLFIVMDGTDQQVPDFTDGCNVEKVERVAGNVAEADRGRIALVSSRAAALFGSYDMVIGTDVDEFLVVDPKLGVSLPEFLSGLETSGHPSFSGLGCDVVQNISCEPKLDRSLGLLEQRQFIILSTRYTKASVLCRPVQWGSGFHRTRHGNFRIVPDLYLFHFGCADLPETDLKMLDADLSARGWGRHLSKRRKLISEVPGLPVRDWDTWTRRARRIQTLVRPPYAWNKPAMFNLKILVRRPERFSGVV